MCTIGSGENGGRFARLRARRTLLREDELEAQLIVERPHHGGVCNRGVLLATFGGKRRSNGLAGREFEHDHFVIPDRGAKDVADEPHIRESNQSLRVELTIIVRNAVAVVGVEEHWRSGLVEACSGEGTASR